MPTMMTPSATVISVHQELSSSVLVVGLVGVGDAGSAISLPSSFMS